MTTHTHTHTRTRTVEHTGALLDHFPLEGLQLAGSPSADDKTTASLQIHPRHCNGLNNMHGASVGSGRVVDGKEKKKYKY